MFLAAAVFAAVPVRNSAAGEAADQTRLSDYIRPLVGTAGREGNTFPGPSAPFGMVQLSPDTDSSVPNHSGTCSGYSYDDKMILGFSLTHLTGTGVPDLGDFLFVPQTTSPSLVAGSTEYPDTGYQSAFSHADESASAGYYKVKLLKSGVVAELTAAGKVNRIMPARSPAVSSATTPDLRSLTL